MQNKLLVLFFFTLILISCRETTVDPAVIVKGYEYYPLKKGLYFIYDVDSMDFDAARDSINFRTSYFQIKEVVGDTFKMGNGETGYRVERFKRKTLPTTDTTWPSQPDSVWSVSANELNVVKVENSVRFVKLVFPINEKKKWNGNIYNNRGQDDYLMKNIGKPYSVNGQIYNNTLLVEQSVDTTNLVRRDYRIEVFAKDIGLIYKLKEVYNYRQENIFLKKISTGVKYVEKLAAYGKN